MKKGISIIFLLVYLGIIYMPYAPYIYFVTTYDNCNKEHNITIEKSFNSNQPLIGDICYLEAIKKRADNNVPENTKERPNLIVINNLVYVSAYNSAICIIPLKFECEYIEYSSLINNLIQEVDSPPPKLS